MSPKAEKFSALLKENNIKVFEVTEAQDELQTTVFRSALEAGGQRLPVVVIIDRSLFVIIRTVIAANCLNDEGARVRVGKRINDLNGAYKIFKYYVRDGSLILDICLPASDNGFEPDIVRVALDLAVRHLAETFPSLMEAVWGKEPADGGQKTEDRGQKTENKG
ncbi:MAG: histidine kinase [Candidatus Accumulibacter sp.]|jgi:hypothetical protein|nr:histidine kinase [Accumulibacter sp.]